MTDTAEKEQNDAIASKEADDNSGESVEDILNSIRDIIADEDDEAPASANEATDALEPEEITDKDNEEDILELTDMAEEKPTEPQAPDTDVLEDIDEALQSDEGDVVDAGEVTPPAEETPPAPDAEPAEETPPPPPSDPSNSGKSDLISEPAAAESASKIKNLVDAIPEESIDSPQFRSGTSVEDLVKEALKPMLSEWLNENLPAVVEKVVAREIKRILPKED